jgi:hypothetical protein
MRPAWQQFGGESPYYIITKLLHEHEKFYKNDKNIMLE